MKTALIGSATALVLALGFAGGAMAQDSTAMSKEDMMAKYTVNGQKMTEEGYAQVQARCDELIAKTSNESLASSSNDSAQSNDDNMADNNAMAQAQTDINLDTITASDCTNYGFTNRTE